MAERLFVWRKIRKVILVNKFHWFLGEPFWRNKWKKSVARLMRESAWNLRVRITLIFCKTFYFLSLTEFFHCPFAALSFPSKSDSDYEYLSGLDSSKISDKKTFPHWFSVKKSRSGEEDTSTWVPYRRWVTFCQLMPACLTCVVDRSFDALICQHQCQGLECKSCNARVNELYFSEKSQFSEDSTAYWFFMISEAPV